jgi:magnesium-transporting ATPase (P-type)
LKTDNRELYNYISSSQKKYTGIVTKGALHNILEICSHAEISHGSIVVDISPIKQKIQQRFEELGNKGFRILGVAYREYGLWSCRYILERIIDTKKIDL